MKISNVTVEELAESLDQLFLDIADVKGDTESIGFIVADLKKKNEDMAAILEERDRMNLLMVKHVEKLSREKEFLLMHLGLENIQEKVRKGKNYAGTDK